MAMAGSRQSRADDDYGWVAPKPCTNERTGQEAEAKMGVILALRRYRSGSLRLDRAISAAQLIGLSEPSEG